MSSFGRIFRWTTAGESHSPGMTVIVEGVPAGIPLSAERDIQPQLRRRRPGQSAVTTSRQEEDLAEILSGIENGRTLGTPIAVLVRNKDQRPEDYKFQAQPTQTTSVRASSTNHSDNDFVPRPSHADYTYRVKYAGHVANSGGGRASARETIGRVIAGSIAEAALARVLPSYRCVAWASSIGHISPAELQISSAAAHPEVLNRITREDVDKYVTRMPNGEGAEGSEKLLLELKAQGDSVGGAVSCCVVGVPVGLGEPAFDKLEALLAHAMLSLPATKGFEFGSGFDCIGMKGSEHNDPFELAEELPKDVGATGEPGGSQHQLKTKTNFSGGVQGGISNGMPIQFRVAFKPPATIGLPQQTVAVNGDPVVLAASGRHDPCVVPRAVPIVEAMCAVVILDLLLLQRSREAFQRQREDW
jgi:chorismate synthase